MIAIYRTATGELEAMVVSLDGHDMAGRSTAAVPRDWRDRRWDTTARKWLVDPERITAELVAEVDAERERRQVVLLTPGGAKAVVYAAKAAEVAAFAADPNAPVSFARAEAAATGEPIADIIASYAAGAKAAHTKLARLEAIARAGIVAIRSARGIKAKRAAAAGVRWSAKPPAHHRRSKP